MKSSSTHAPGTAGRVDAYLWFIIACGEYCQASGDEAFLDRVLPMIEKTRALTAAVADRRPWLLLTSA